MQLTLLTLGLMALGMARAQAPTEAEMIEILNSYNTEATAMCTKSSLANWAVQTDVLNTTLVVEQVRERKCKL